MAQLAATRRIVGDNELVIRVETTATVRWCPRCGVRAQAQDRTTRSVPDLLCFGRTTKYVNGLVDLAKLITSDPTPLASDSG